MFDLLNTNGLPSRTWLSAPTVYLPSFPAVKVSPCLPVMVPSTRALAAYAAR
jgi:hypothetical protein